MSFNTGTLYMAALEYELKMQSSSEQTLNLLNKLQEINNYQEAVNWLKKNWNITDVISDFPVAEDVCLTTKMSGNNFCVKVQQRNKVQVYRFVKGV